MPETDLVTTVATLMQARQTILPKRLVEPGPDAGQLKCILNADSLRERKSAVKSSTCRIPGCTYLHCRAL